MFTYIYMYMYNVCTHIFKNGVRSQVVQWFTQQMICKCSTRPTSSMKSILDVFGRSFAYWTWESLEIVLSCVFSEICFAELDNGKIHRKPLYLMVKKTWFPVFIFFLKPIHCNSTMCYISKSTPQIQHILWIFLDVFDDPTTQESRNCWKVKAQIVVDTDSVEKHGDISLFPHRYIFKSPMSKSRQQTIQFLTFGGYHEA